MWYSQWTIIELRSRFFAESKCILREPDNYKLSRLVMSNTSLSARANKNCWALTGIFHYCSLHCADLESACFMTQVSFLHSLQTGEWIWLESSRLPPNSGAGSSSKDIPGTEAFNWLGFAGRLNGFAAEVTSIFFSIPFFFSFLTVTACLLLTNLASIEVIQNNILFIADCLMVCSNS